MGRAAATLIALLVSSFPTVVGAQERAAAVFDFELIDTSRDDQFMPPSAEHQARLGLVSDQLRRRLAESHRFAIADIAPVIREARASNLQACGGCDVRFAG